MTDFAALREQMVNGQIAARNITNGAVLEAMRRVPRERFVPQDQQSFAYDDSPLPIGEGQTISQPYVVALMSQALELDGDERVLEIGTGSGYAAAILGEIADEVHTVETVAVLADRARAVLADLGYANIHVHHADGTLGWAAEAPFDAIVVTAAAPDVPDALKAQLAIGGRLVLPVGRSKWSQDLVRVTREGEDDFRSDYLTGVRFVPLIGEQGWPSAS